MCVHATYQIGNSKHYHIDIHTILKNNLSFLLEKNIFFLANLFSNILSSGREREKFFILPWKMLAKKKHIFIKIIHTFYVIVMHGECIVITIIIIIIMTIHPSMYLYIYIYIESNIYLPTTTKKKKNLKSSQERFLFFIEEFLGRIQYNDDAIYLFVCYWKIIGISISQYWWWWC